MSDRGYVVVTFSASECAVYPDMKCVASVYGPFTGDEAKAFHERCQDWERPHTLTLTPWDQTFNVLGEQHVAEDYDGNLVYLVSVWGDDDE